MMATPEEGTTEEDLADLGEYPPVDPDVRLSLWTDRSGKYLQAIETHMRQAERHRNRR